MPEQTGLSPELKRLRERFYANWNELKLIRDFELNRQEIAVRPVAQRIEELAKMHGELASKLVRAPIGVSEFHPRLLSLLKKHPYFGEHLKNAGEPAFRFRKKAESRTTPKWHFRP